MKFLSKRNKFLNEAKVGDVILPRQKEAVKGPKSFLKWKK